MKYFQELLAEGEFANIDKDNLEECLEVLQNAVTRFDIKRNSEEAAKLAGISTDRIILLSFSILGALVGFTALIYVGRLASVEITVGQDLPLSAIAATVIGGTSVKGGKGSVVGTMAGVLFIAIMKNGIVLLGIPSLWEKAVVGFLIIISVIIDLLINKRLERRQREELSAQKKGSIA